jgi:hypothetical protein
VSARTKRRLGGRGTKDVTRKPHAERGDEGSGHGKTAARRLAVIMSGDAPQITAQSNAVCPLQSLEFTMLSSAGDFFPPGARSTSNPCVPQKNTAKSSAKIAVRSWTRSNGQAHAQTTSPQLQR